MQVYIPNNINEIGKLILVLLNGLNWVFILILLFEFNIIQVKLFIIELINISEHLNNFD